MNGNTRWPCSGGASRWRLGLGALGQEDVRDVVDVPRVVQRGGEGGAHGGLCGVAPGGGGPLGWVEARREGTRRLAESGAVIAPRSGQRRLA